MAFKIRDIHQCGAVWHPELVCAAFALGVLFHFAHMTTVFVHHPHSRINQIVRSFVAEGDGVVVEWAINRVAEPVFLFMNGRACASF
ncbi:hypothetical protein D3C87_1502350 [compost metagenome]